jgi:hypothetical protein
MPLEVDIDEIVRQVVAQLRKEPATTANGQNSRAQSPTAAVTNKSSDAAQLEITEQLVTLATLEHRLTGIRHVVLARGAVVTPSVRDVFRERKITVSYSSGIKATTNVAIVLGAAELGDSESTKAAATFIESLSRDGVAIERIATTGLASVVRELGDHAARGGRPTVLLTSRPSAAACLANRVEGVRAVGGRDVSAVRLAMAEVAANFLAFDPAVAPAAFRRLVAEFRRDWPRRVPELLDVHFPRV